MNRTEPYQHTNNGNGQRSPEIIQEDIKRTRQQIDESVEKLSEETSPSSVSTKLMDQLTQYTDSLDLGEVREKAARIGRSTSRRIRENPLPVALGLLAAAAAFIPRDLFRRNDKNSTESLPEPDLTAPGCSVDPVAHGTIRDWEDAANAEEKGENCSASDSGRIHDAKEKISQTAETVKETGQQWMQHGKESISEGASQIAGKAGRAREGAARRFESGKESHPELLALGAIACGFIASLALPRTKHEDELCGESADQLKQKVAENGREFLSENQLDAEGLEDRAEKLIDHTEEAAKEKIDKHLNS